MQIVSVKYSELRATTESVIEFIKKDYWWAKDSNLRTVLEYDLGISGDDGWELMEKFSEKFSVDLAGFKFLRFFSPEGQDFSFLLLIPAVVASLIAGILKYSLIILFYIFSRKIIDRLLQFHSRSIYYAACKNLEREDRDVLTVDDLVTSAICRKFTLRREARFELKK